MKGFKTSLHAIILYANSSNHRINSMVRKCIAFLQAIELIRWLKNNNHRYKRKTKLRVNPSLYAAKYMNPSTN